MSHNRNILVAIVTRAGVSVAVLLAASLIFAALYATRPQPIRTDSHREPPSVQVMRVVQAPVHRRWSGYGTAQPLKSADVPARVTATVVTRPEAIRPGRAVAQGDLIVQLDDSDFTRQVEITTQTVAELQAQIDRLGVETESWTRRVALLEEEHGLAQAEFGRAQEALERNAAKQREVDLVRQNVVAAERSLVAAKEELNKIPFRLAGLTALKESQQASLRLARQNVERSRIVAPISGVLQFVDVEEGESLTAGERVARLVSLDVIEIPLRMPAGARPFIAPGAAIQLRSSGSLDQQWEGQIVRVSPEDDADTRTFTAYVELRQDAQSASSLAPGQFVEGSVQSTEAMTRTVLPRRALHGKRILIVKDGRITSETVAVDFHVDGERPESGLPDQQWVALWPELPTGTLVVIEAGRSLPVGLEVRGHNIAGEQVPDAAESDESELARTRGGAEASP